mmetsp:Transcript_48641/g.78328  ORF Transcript_48641/g.78328 Transcript_48641/m.78328 type:complete len:173 (-) Transcript_48641:1447-1965(-)
MWGLAKREAKWTESTAACVRAASLIARIHKGIHSTAVQVEIAPVDVPLVVTWAGNWPQERLRRSKEASAEDLQKQDLFFGAPGCDGCANHRIRAYTLQIWQILKRQAYDGSRKTLLIRNRKSIFPKLQFAGRCAHTLLLMIHKYSSTRHVYSHIPAELTQAAVPAAGLTSSY